MNLLYWSGSLQYMVYASLFSNWALCSYSCSLELKRFNDPPWVITTRAGKKKTFIISIVHEKKTSSSTDCSNEIELNSTQMLQA